MVEQFAIDFDHHSKEFLDNWPESWNDLRSECPVGHSSSYGGFWVVTGYDCVTEVARDDVHFSSHNDIEGDHKAGGGILIPSTELRFGIIEYDAPLHVEVRRLLLPWFTRNAAEQLRPYLAEFANNAVNQFIETGSCDLVKDFTTLVPAGATLKLLGLDGCDASFYADTFHRHMFATHDEEEYKSVRESMLVVDEDVESAIRDRRNSPRDNDLISLLCEAKILGNSLNNDQLKEIMRTLIAGGLDTSASLTNCALAWLGQNQDARVQLIQNPGLIPSATEEFLRYFGPSQAMARTVTSNYELAGRMLVPGDRVLLSWVGANHDPQEFDRPEAIDLSRSPNRHTSFGVGAHRCIGSHLGRVEFQVMLSEILRRMPDYEIDYEIAERYPTLGIINGYVSLPAVFSAGSAQRV